MYLNINVKRDGLADAVKGLRAMNFKGINLTIPHKVSILEYLDEVSDDAALIGAVNTVWRNGNRLIGENTDGKGFLRALTQDAGVDPEGRSVVILGAGGAARAVSVELALAGARHITIVNRTEEKGRGLAEQLNGRTDADAVFHPWDNPYVIPNGTDILLNATSIGLFPDVDEKPIIEYESITDKMTVCDVIPNPPHTPFLSEAAKRGARTINGLGMLVYQAAIAFRIWTGKDAPLEEMQGAIGREFGIQ